VVPGSSSVEQKSPVNVQHTQEATELGAEGGSPEDGPLVPLAVCLSKRARRCCSSSSSNQEETRISSK
jgi:hypothetical protein